MKKLSYAIALSTLLAACGQGGGGAGGGAPGGPGAAMPPAEVDVVTVTAGGATLTQDLPGRLQAVRSAQVRARVEGVVEKRLFTEGTDVKAGTPLFTIDARTYKASVDSARADVALAKLTVDRYKPLLDLKAVSQQEYDQAAAKLKQAEAALAKAELDFENASVPAPISGRVGRALVTEGALVGRGDATPLALIEQLDPIYANFTQPGSDLLQLRRAIQSGKLQQSKETKVELVMEDGTTYPLHGKLLFSDLAMDPNTGSVLLRAEFPNPKRDLLPGMFVRVRFPQASMDKALKVPQRAVVSSPQGQAVMVVDAQGKVAPRPIKTGAMAGTDWIVTEGLQGGEQVIVNGLQKAKPGATVKPVQWNPNGAPAATPTKAAATQTPAPAAASAAAQTPAAADKPAAQPAKQGS